MAKTKSESSGPLDKSPSHLLHRALQRALDIYAETAGPTAVTQRQFAVLAAVAAREGLDDLQPFDAQAFARGLVGLNGG